MFLSETTSFHYFSQRFRISKNIGHLTSGRGGKKTFKRYLKSEQTDKQTNRQTDGQAHRQTDKSTYGKHRPRRPMLWKHQSQQSWLFVGFSQLCMRKQLNRRRLLSIWKLVKEQTQNLWCGSWDALTASKSLKHMTKLRSHWNSHHEIDK